MGFLGNESKAGVKIGRAQRAVMAKEPTIMPMTEPDAPRVRV